MFHLAPVFLERDHAQFAQRLEPLNLIVGHDVLERYGVDIDWPRHRLRFHEPASFVHTAAGW